MVLYAVSNKNIVKSVLPSEQEALTEATRCSKAYPTEEYEVYEMKLIARVETHITKV